MESNLISLSNRKIANIKLSNLSDKIYGPRGDLSREVWRNECLLNLVAGKEAFALWQASWQDQIINNLPNVSFGGIIYYRDGSSKTISNVLKSPHTLDYVGNQFNNDLLALEFNFLQPTDFRCGIFIGQANFSNVIFNDDANFSGATFIGKASFNYALFNANSDFHDGIFNMDTDFNNARFTGDAYFTNVIFKSSNFTSATFILNAFFNNVNFLSKAQYISVTFSGDVYFTRSIFSGIANFENTSFNLDAYFLITQFKNKTYFIETIFNGDAEFSNANFLDDIRFFGTKFKGGAFFNETIFINKAAKRLGQMKRLAEDNGHTDQALNFNALELQYKAKDDDAGIWFMIFTSIYGKASDFGRSFVRPLIIYFILFLITLSVGLKSAANSVPDVHGCNENLNVTYKNMFNLPCLLYSKNDANNINLNGYRAAFEFAAYRASGIIDFSDNDKQTAAVSQRVFGQPIEPGWARAWGIFKAIASTALLFLAALGLRNKYRIK